MRIGVIGAGDDAHCRALGATLSDMGVGSVVVESRGMLDRVSHTLDRASLTVAGEDLSDVAAWYLHYVAAPYYRPESPGGPAATDPALRAQVAFQTGWLQNLAHRGIPVINGPTWSLGRSKPLQLSIAQEIGLPIPKTIITNSLADIEAFGSQHGQLVHKPVDGGDICRLLDPVKLQKLDRVLSSPIIVQQLVEGSSVRVTMSRRHIYSAVAISSDYLDYRDDPIYRSGETTYQPVTVPARTTNLLVQFMERYRLDFAGIDLIRTRQDDHVFLEANSSPMWLEIEHRSGHPITSRLAELLIEFGKRSGRLVQNCESPNRIASESDANEPLA